MWCWGVSQIRTNVTSLECVPTSATTLRVPTSAAATSTSPESMTPARLMVSTSTIIDTFQACIYLRIYVFFTSALYYNDLLHPQLQDKCSTSQTTVRSAAWTLPCQTGAMSRSSRVMPTCALMPWTCMSRRTAFTGQTGTPGAFLPMICLLPPPHPIATVTDAKVTRGSQTWR